ncbi:ABC transporter ATP-binding protein/permease [Dactylosporangium vinaceum]|uniref:ATP-binding cassette domain-containing protein n=1 Tax=Dactylosporangium vinaceum TaxID=53362 RepID=A0ABV5M1Y3_9ACTN|nr:ABC transporter ATP-binding protein/permease [Dactylosporangium vinaceum]UAB99340.1 ABC transporter ATP-binding protein/permease [Dactylosporangium vinaceum]
MRLLRDLWATSPRRTALVGLLVVLGAAGQALASAVGGTVLIHRSWTMFTVLVAALLASVLTDLGVSLLMARVTADWCADVRRRLCRVALGQDLPTLETTPVGELLDRIDSDVLQVSSELRNAGVRLLQSACYTVLSVATTLFVWWPAGVAMIVIAVALTLGLRKPTATIAARRMAEEEAWSDVAAVMEESIHGQDDVRTTLARPYVLRLYARRAAAVLERGRRVWHRSAAVTSIASGFVRLTIAVIVLGGVWALATDRIDVARLSAVWLLALGFGATVEHTSRMVPNLQYALGAWARIQQLRDSRQEPHGGRTPTPGDLEVSHLTFRYSDQTRKPALRDVSLTFARGRSYALIGRTGSGKSTLAKVLTRAVDIPRGTVFLGGTDLLDLDLEELRRWIAVVPQRTEILAGTLAENIALFDPSLLHRAAEAVAELGLTAWVAELPGGLATRLGDGGHVLSAGQEQLVAFSRIMVRDPQVVILDEATARLDPVTEARVQQATDRLLAGRIGIIVAHRLSSVQQCDEVVVLADGAVVEAGPLASSERFATLLAASSFERQVSAAPTARPVVTSAGLKAEPPPLPSVPKARTLWNIFKLATNDVRFGLVSVAMFAVMTLLGLDGSVLAWLWADVVDGAGAAVWPAAGIAAALLLPAALPYFSNRWYPEWWVRQLLRISLRLVHGQTGARRVSKHTPAEVVAHGGDTERVVVLADNLIDQWVSLWVMVSMTVVSGSFVPAAFMAATIVLSGLAATLFGPVLKRSAQATVAARAAFATALVSSLSAARTVKLSGATEPVLAHLAALDRTRSDSVRREIAVQVWARCTPAVASGLLPIGAWALLLTGELSPGATLVAVATLNSAWWFASTTASLISQLPSARVWTRRAVEMAGSAEYAAAVPGVDLSAGTAPAPATAPRHPLRRLELDGFAAVHEDGTVAVHDLDLSVERGQLVLVVGPVGSGKSSLLRALAGIVHHTGRLRWNGEPVTEPEMFLRPNQIGYVAQLPRVLSGTVADNIALGHEVDADTAVTTAQLQPDLTAAGAGLGLLIGHKGTRLSGGQLQRLALARALAPRTELLIADDVSSALDVTTELALWRALRDHGVTVIGSTSKRAALTQADRVVVLQGGTAAAQGTWRELEPEWGHLAG